MTHTVNYTRWPLHMPVQKDRLVIPCPMCGKFGAALIERDMRDQGILVVGAHVVHKETLVPAGNDVVVTSVEECQNERELWVEHPEWVLWKKRLQR